MSATTSATRVNGEAEERVPVSNRGLAYGDGVFTTARVVGGRPLLWDRHIRRLERDCERIGLHFDRETLQREVGEICAAAPDLPTGALKVILTRGDGPRGYRPPPDSSPDSSPGGAVRILQLTPLAPYPPEYWERGVAAMVCRLRLSDSPTLAGVKHLNRLEQVLASAERGDEYQEGLMRDATGRVVEGTMTNLFAVAGDELWTPRLDRCGVAGVMRGHLIDRAKEAGWKVREIGVWCDDLYRAEGVFLCNALIGAWPVTRIGERDCSSPEFVAGRFRQFLGWAGEGE